jgi:multidrug resistance efflux pump
MFHGEQVEAGMRARNGMMWGGGAVGALVAIASLAVGPVEQPKSPPGDKGKSSGGDSGGGRTADHASASLQSFDIATTVSGELEARNQIEIRSQLERDSAIVQLVPEGTKVKAGTVLIRLNEDEIAEQVQEETLRVETARADLIAAENAYAIQVSKNESDLRKAIVKEELAQLALSQWLEGDMQALVLKNRLAVERAERELQRLSEKLEESRKLFERKYLSADELKQDELKVLEADAALRTARLEEDAYVNFKRPMDEKDKISTMYEAQAEVERVRLNNERELASKEADRNNKSTQMTIRTNKLARLKEQLGNCVIKAPSDGLVVYSTSMERNRWGGNEGPLQIGQKVFPNQLLMALPDTTEMIAAVKVHESLAGRIKPGQPATIKVEAAGGRVFQGKVESIGVLAETGGWRDPNLREYTVRVALDNAEDSSPLKPSMRCEGQLVLGRVENALAVPVQAVFNDGAVRYVYTPSGSRFKRVPVALGRRSETVAEITAGLEAGGVVLLREPSPGEVLAGAWDPKALATAGYAIVENGRIVSLNGGEEGGRRRGGKGGDAAKVVDAKAAEVKAPEAKAETKPAEGTAVEAEAVPAAAEVTKK